MKELLYQLSNEIEWFLDFCRIDRTAGAVGELPALPSRKPERAAVGRKYNFFTKPRTIEENQKIVINIFVFLIYLIFALLLIMAFVLVRNGVIV